MLNNRENGLKDTESVKVSTKGRIVIPVGIRKKLGIVPGLTIEVSTNEDGQIILQKKPDQLDWNALIDGLPNEKVSLDSVGHYEPKKSPEFDRWMNNDD